MTFDADRAAYQRLRDRGLHPDQIDGSAEIEATATRESLGWGKNLTAEQIIDQREAQGVAQEIGGTP